MANKADGAVYDYWWQPLLAIPPSPDSPEYERLRRLWWDQTRVRKVAGKNTPEFYHSAWETHLTAVLWENFAFLPIQQWIPLLAAEAGLKRLSAGIQEAHWSYGWEASVESKRGIRILDVVLHWRDKAGEEGVLVVEVKRPNARIANDKDLDPQYYLDVPQLRSFGERRSLLYLTSEKLVPEARKAVERGSWDVGFVSWEALAGIQIQSALAADCGERIRRALAASIHRQFLSYGVTASRPPLDYLASERSRHEIQAAWINQQQTVAERRKELFRLPLARGR